MKAKRFIYIRPSNEIIESLRNNVFEMGYYEFLLCIATDTTFGLWLKDIYKPLENKPFQMDLEPLKNFYSIHVKNLVAHPKKYLTSHKYIIWN